VVAGSGLMLAMCCALVVVLLSGSTAQTLQMFDVFPADECLESARLDLPYPCKGGGWTNIESLREVLEPQGVEFKQTENFWAITFPEGEPVVLNTESATWSFYDDASNEPVILNTLRDYVRIRDLISSLHLSILPVKIEGWEKPIITVGNTSFDIDLVSFAPETNYDEPLYTSKDFYSEPIYWEIFNSLPSKKTYSNTADFQSTATEAKRLRVTDKEDSVYALIVVMDSSKVTYIAADIENTQTMYSDISRVNADGALEFRSPLGQELLFKDQVSQLSEVGNALLVRLSGDLTSTLGYIIVPPDQITLE
jgi:hypothetical protein